MISYSVNFSQILFFTQIYHDKANFRTSWTSAFFYLYFLEEHYIICMLLFLCLCIGLDIAPLAEDESVSSQAHLSRTHPRLVSEEPLDGILSPELDKMVTDGLYNKCIPC